MSTPILVTGGTGTLGRAVVSHLHAGGLEHRVLSRKSGPGLVTGDLSTGDGVDDAVRGVATILHLATAPRHDAAATRTLVEAASRLGHPHLVYVSIVGIDRVPLPYYREKLATERVVEHSGLPWTILRATQFHDLLDALFGVLARTGVLPVLSGARFQPVDVRDVATRLAELATVGASGRAADMGGPQVRAMDELARAWLAATARRRPVLPLRLPGGVVRGVREGALTTPEHPDGVITFEQYLEGAAARSRR